MDPRKEKLKKLVAFKIDPQLATFEALHEMVGKIEELGNKKDAKAQL